MTQNSHPAPSPEHTVAVAIRETGGRSAPAKRGFVQRALRSPMVLSGLALTLFIVLVALLGGLVAPFGPTEIVARPYAQPGEGLLLGADALGRDVLSRVLYGGRDLIWMSLGAATLGVVLGVAFGTFAAMGGRITENVVMRGVDVLLAFPSMLLVLLFVSMLGPSPVLLVLLVALTHIAPVSRVTRGAVLPIKDREFVLWARLAGFSRLRVIVREILPGITSPVLVEFGLRLMWSVAVFAALSFLGYGMQPPSPDWGLMINENRGALRSQPWAMLSPILMVAVFTAGLSLLTEGVSRLLNRTEDTR